MSENLQILYWSGVGFIFVCYAMAWLNGHIGPMRAWQKIVCGIAPFAWPTTVALLILHGLFRLGVWLLTNDVEAKTDATPPTDQMPPPALYPPLWVGLRNHKGDLVIDVMKSTESAYPWLVKFDNGKCYTYTNSGSYTGSWSHPYDIIIP